MMKAQDIIAWILLIIVSAIYLVIGLVVGDILISALRFIPTEDLTTPALYLFAASVYLAMDVATGVAYYSVPEDKRTFMDFIFSILAGVIVGLATVVIGFILILINYFFILLLGRQTGIFLYGLLMFSFSILVSTTVSREIKIKLG